MYLNNAGAGKTSEKTHRIIVEHLELEREIGAYDAASRVKEMHQKFYTNAAESINAKSYEEIAFVDSASRGWNLMVRGLKLTKDDKILTLSSEFGTNLITLYKKVQESNAKLEVFSCDYSGEFDLDEFEKVVKNGVTVIAISHAIAHGSIVNPVNQIGEISKKYGCIYLVDGCQSVGNIDVNVQKMNCDAFVTTGRKWLRGPRGTGYLYVKNGSKIFETQLDLASTDLDLSSTNEINGLSIVKHAKKFELWEKNIASVLGFSNAIEELNRVIATPKFKIKTDLAFRIRNSVQKNSKFTLIGPVISKSGVCGFFTNDSSDENSFLERLSSIEFNISSMSDWDCPLHFPSNGVKNIFRISPHFYSNYKDVELISNIISQF